MDYKITHQKAASNVFVSHALLDMFTKLIDEGVSLDAKLQSADEQYRQTGELDVAGMQEHIKSLEALKVKAKLTQGKINTLTDGQ